MLLRAGGVLGVQDGMPTEADTPSPTVDVEARTSRWSKPAKVWKMAQALTPRTRNSKQHMNASPGDTSVQLFTPLSGVPMTTTTESQFVSHGRNSSSGAPHLNPFIEQ